MAKMKNIPEDTKGSAAKVVAMRDWKDGLKKNNDGSVKAASPYNLQLIVEHDKLLKNMVNYDEFSEQLVKPKPISELHLSPGFWQDEDSAALRLYVDEHYSVAFSRDNVADVVITVAKRHPVNPVKQRIESEIWDGKPRAERYFIDYLGAEDNEYTRAVTKTWLTGAVARIYDPGCKFEIVPILQGPQGIGKSTAARNLFPDKFNDSLQGMGRDKDDYQLLVGSWILEIAELSAMRKTEIERTKNFVSGRTDNFRGAYNRYSSPHPRKCAFIGSTNQHKYLKDETGERRFFPIPCGVQTAIKDVWHPDDNDILQILAEAKHCYDQGSPIFLNDRIVDMAKKYQEDAADVNVVKTAIVNYLNETESTFITTRQLMEDLFDVSPDKYYIGKANALAKQVGAVMDNLDGWDKARQRINRQGNPVTGYAKTGA